MYAWKYERVHRSFTRKLLESVQIARLTHHGGRRCKIVMLYDDGKSWSWPKKTPGIRGCNSRQSGRLEISGGAIGGLDDCQQPRRQRYRQSKTHVDSGQQAGLDSLVGVADHCLEWRDHVPNHIFRSVVQQHGEAALAVKARALVSDDLDQQ